MKKIKTFWRVTDEQYESIQKQKDHIDTLYQEDFNKSYEAQELFAKQSNSICPLCGGNNIVNKIHDVRGTSSGGFFSSYGSVTTNPVNHCSACGNEWHKYEVEVCSPNFCARHDAYRLIEKLYDKNFSEKDIPDNLKMKPLYAETVWLFIEANPPFVYERPSGLWRKIRKHFPSVKES